MRGESPGREDFFVRFINGAGKGSVNELTFQEASSLIDGLKNVRLQGTGTEEGRTATGRQKEFITSLQDTEERRNAAREFLRSHDRESMNDLKMTEASELIDVLVKMPKGDPVAASVSQKQLQFIRNLQTNDKNIETTGRYLEERGKKSIEDLTKKEASILIDMLWGTK